MNQLNINVGDMIYCNYKLCPIVSLSSIGVTIKLDTKNKFISCNDLLLREFEYCIKYEKLKLNGESHTDTEEKALKEKELLESSGWTCTIYKREVKSFMKNRNLSKKF